ncbi:unnamed protein product [Sphagnum jensenii]
MMNDIFIKIDDHDPNSVCVLFKPKEIRFVNQTIDDRLVTVPVALYYKLNYYVKMEAKYEQTIIKSEQTKIVKDTDWVEVVKLPIMVGSKYCASKKGKTVYDPLFSREDPGGYFILKGNKKAIFFKPRMTFNQVLILPNGKGNISDNSNMSIYDFSCIVISKNAYAIPSFSHYLIINYKNSILYLTIQSSNDQSFNLFSVIKSISDLKDAEILNYLLGDIYLKNSQEEVYSLVTMTLQDSNKTKIDSKNVEIIKYSIAHVQDDAKKVEFLLYCVLKLIRVSLKYEPIDDRDNYSRTKVMDSPGSLIEELFINYFKITKKVIKDKLKLIQASKLNDLDILNDLKLFQIEYMLKFFISSDHWGPSKKKGVCELIQPTNYIHQVECLRKVVEDEKDKNIILEKRKSRTDYQGIICSITTPTSPKVGLHKYLALMGFINGYDYKQHHLYMKEIAAFIDGYTDDSDKKYYNIFLDGIMLCSSSIQMIHNLGKFIDELKFKRRHEFSMLTVYYVDYTRLQMNINTHGGRLLAPVIRLKDNKIPISFEQISKIQTLDELYDKYPGLIDYIDTYWMAHNPIAMSMKEIKDYNEELKINYSPKARYVYAVVHVTPYAQYSIPIALNVFASKQAAIRDCHLAKQYLSSLGFGWRMDYMSMDKTKKFLVHGNLPLSKSPIDKYVGCSEIPITITMFAELSADVTNQEDALVINWNAIARGALAIYEFKTYEMFISFKSDEKFFKPIRQKSGNHNFSKLGPDGIIKMNETVKYGDVLICKIENKNDDSQQIKPKIEYYDQYSVGRVCKIERYRNEQEAREYVIVKICKTSLGESADKMCLLPTTRVLTTAGWKQIDKVCFDDKVAVLDVANDNVLYERPINIYRYDYAGKMYQLTSPFVDLTTTPNHRMWVKSEGDAKFGFKYSQDIFGAKLRYKKNISNYVPERWIGRTFVVNNSAADINDWLVLFGFLLTRGQPCRHTVTICGGRVPSNIGALAKKLGYQLCRQTHTSLAKIHNSELASCIKCSRKKLPDWVWSLNREQSRLLLKSMRHHRIGCIDRLVLQCGYSLSPRRSVVRTNLEPEVGTTSTERWIDYCGQVYCLQVSSGVFLVKENNKPVWTGNSTDMGQKGVIGQIASDSEFGHSDLNFVATVRCSPSAHTRMTGGQLIVPITNYYAILTGNIVENNTFNPIDINAMRNCLKYYGFQENFLSRVYREDSQLISLNAVDIVPLTFRRLKQLADDGHVKKLDSGNDPITRNPIKGKLGGSKIGRMELDSLQTHGVPEYIQSLTNYNDKYYICNTCQIKIDNKDENCKICNKKDNIIRVKIPAVFAAVVDYCLPLGILIKMHVNENSIIT